MFCLMCALPVRRKTRVSAQKIAAAKEGIDEGLKSWDPAKDPLIEVNCLAVPECLNFVWPHDGAVVARRSRHAVNLRCLNAQGDPFKTLFVARVSYDATEKKLKREFEEYGPVKSVRLVTQKDSGEQLFLSWHFAL